MFTFAISKFVASLWPKKKQKDSDDLPLELHAIIEEEKSRFPVNTFPNEIWLQIIDRMSPSQVQRLYSLNALFFRVAMENKYRQLCFAYLDGRMVRNFVRLMDPVVANRVRILHVYPGCLVDILQMGSSPEHSHLVALLKGVLATGSTEELICSMLKVLSSLPNLSDCQISWRNPDRIFSPAAGPFLANFVGAIGPTTTLRKLSLDLSADHMLQLTQPDVFAALRLEELSISLHQSSMAGLRTTLAPIIHLNHPTLRVLSFETSSRFAAELEWAIATFESLCAVEELTITIPLEPPHLGDPMTFRSFLHKQRRTLKVLRLKANRTTGADVNTIPQVLDESFLRWIESVLSSPVPRSSSILLLEDAIPPLRLPHLHHFELTSSFLPKQAVLHCLRHFQLYGTPGLESVAVTGLYHPFVQIEEIINIFDQRSSEEEAILTSRSDRPQLRCLRLGLVNLSPQLIDVLATNLPNLRRLDLIVRYVQPDIEEWSETPQRTYYWQSFLQERRATHHLDAFLEVFTATRLYPSWMLHTLSILAISLPSRPSYEPELFGAFLHAIPQLKFVS